MKRPRTRTHSFAAGCFSAVFAVFFFAFDALADLDFDAATFFEVPEAFFDAVEDFFGDAVRFETVAFFFAAALFFATAFA